MLLHDHVQRTWLSPSLGASRRSHPFGWTSRGAHLRQNQNITHCSTGPSSSGSSREPSSSSSRSSAGELSRRGLLQSLTVGGAYAWAGRNAYAADVPSLQAQLEGRVHEFSLPNGLRFIVSERHAAPIVSCHVYADVGWVFCSARPSRRSSELCVLMALSCL